MGSFSGTLEIDGTVYQLISLKYSLNRNTDDKGRPSSSIKGGRVTATVASTEDTAIYESMINQYKPIPEGKVVFKKMDEDSTMKELVFKNAYTVFFEEMLDVNNEIPMQLTATFSAEQITVGNGTLDNTWPTV